MEEKGKDVPTNTFNVSRMVLVMRLALFTQKTEVSRTRLTSVFLQALLSPYHTSLALPRTPSASVDVGV